MSTYTFQTPNLPPLFKSTISKELFYSYGYKFSDRINPILLNPDGTNLDSSVITSRLLAYWISSGVIYRVPGIGMKTVEKVKMALIVELAGT